MRGSSSSGLPRVRRAAVKGRSGHRRLRTPVLLQLEMAECGAACLGIVLAHFGRRATLAELHAVCGVSRDGCSAADIARAATTYGLKATGWRREINQLREIALPAIVFWRFNHFVVLEGLGKNCFYVNDPASGHRTVSADTFDSDYTGVVLTFEPTGDFEPGGVQPGVVQRLWPWLQQHYSALAFAAVCGLLLALPGLALPLLLSIFVDDILLAGQTGWNTAFIGATVGAGAVTWLCTWLQMQMLRRVAIRVSIRQSLHYVSRLFRMPIHFFTQRLAGDLTSRIQLIDQVATLGTCQVVGIVIELVTTLAFFVLMLCFDVTLALVVAAIGIACIGLMRSVIRQRTDCNHRLRREQGLLMGFSMAGLRYIAPMRATAAENDFFARWSGRQACELNARQTFSELGHVTEAFPPLFLMLCASAVLGIGGLRVMSGEMSIGVLLGFYVVASNFMHPIGRFVQLADLLQVLEADLHRLDDILAGPADAPASGTEPGGGVGPRITTIGGRLRLIGHLELRNVTFGFQHHHPPLIERFSLALEPGQRVAVVGPSGSGKSTLALLVAGTYRPQHGEILFDGHRRDEIPRQVLSRSLAVVSQQPALFQATIRDNLTLWNPEVPEEHVVAAARDAAIHDEIIARPLGYDSLVEEGGRNFSGGQQLRLEIARALTLNPSILVLDEATSALDTLTEAHVDDALRRRGCTCLIVAHRLSTIRDADWIVVLDGGRVAQQGVHDDLVAEDGLYRDLVHAD